MVLKIDNYIDEKINILNGLRESEYIKNVVDVAEVMVSSLRNGKKIMTAGNGGSAADAQHFTGEIVGRFLVERKPYASISLVVDPVVMTCISNDYGYESAIARQVEGVGTEGDVLLTISTSGTSMNMINAINAAKQKGIKTVALVGKDGGEMVKICDYPLVVPSDKTPRIQEIHTFTVHLLCELVEQEMSYEK